MSPPAHKEMENEKEMFSPGHNESGNFSFDNVGLYYIMNCYFYQINK